MIREDYDMPFLLKFENVAWYSDGCVKILDRRVYPQQVKYVECYDYQEVVQAIKDMVTQSTGPYAAVAMAMVLAANKIKNNNKDKQIEYLTTASSELANSRLTSSNRYLIITEKCKNAAIWAINHDTDSVQATLDCAVETMNNRYSTMQKAGDYLCELIEDGSSILTQCYGETIIGALIRAAKKTHKQFKVFCAETRPYFQGARLTSSCFASMGFDTTVIGDNMVAYLMETEDIGMFTSAADTITLDGHIANKVGTLQMAILAKHFGVPYYVTGMPDKEKPSSKDIVIEQRNPEQLLVCNGVKNTLEQVKGLYPAFDITPPSLISAFVTNRGVFQPANLHDYKFDSDVCA